MAKSRPQDGALKKNDLIQAVVEGMSSDGSGIVRHEGMVLFVPQTAVGQGAEKLWLWPGGGDFGAFS